MPPITHNLVAAIERPNGKPCVVKHVERRGLRVIVEAWCGTTFNAADGVTQLHATSDFCLGCVSAIKAAGS